jgi:soluble P-type ATPase
MKYIIPHVGTIEIDTIVLDLNGTLSVHGRMVEGAQKRIGMLKKLGFKIILFSGDQRGHAADLCKRLGIEFRKAETSADKEKFFLGLDTDHTAAIGNARIDIGKFKHAKLSIATLQAEGIHVGILPHVDIIVPTINDALDLFLDPNALIATMRK